jgi:hypothetical protein
MKLPKLSRNQWILCFLLLILTGEVTHYIWSHWGLVTVHAKGTPLSQVIRSIEKQGHVTIKTNMDLTKPVQMWVDSVTVAEAMETLAVNTEARWQLTYFLGPDKTTVSTALATFTSGQRNEGWRRIFIGMPPVGDEPDVLPDPRKDPWVVKEAKEPTLQSYLQEAAKNVAAAFYVPDSFNPPVKSAPRSGAISSSLPRLASAAKAKYEEVFVLQGFGDRTADRGDRRDRADRGGDDGEPRFAGNFGGGDRGPRGGGFDRSAFEERIQNEINKLPSSEREAAQKEHDDRKKFFDAIKDLPQDQKMAAIQQMMSDPNVQDKMDNANNNREARRSPQARIQRAGGYLSRKAAAEGR